MHDKHSRLITCFVLGQHITDSWRKIEKGRIKKGCTLFMIYNKQINFMHIDIGVT